MFLVFHVKLEVIQSESIIHHKNSINIRNTPLLAAVFVNNKAPCTPDLMNHQSIQKQGNIFLTFDSPYYIPSFDD